MTVSDAFVEELLDIAREQSHADAVLVVKDRIQKDVVAPLKCRNPHPDGGVEIGVHSFDKDGFCNYCGTRT